MLNKRDLFWQAFTVVSSAFAATLVIFVSAKVGVMLYGQGWPLGAFIIGVISLFFVLNCANRAHNECASLWPYLTLLGRGLLCAAIVLALLAAILAPRPDLAGQVFSVATGLLALATVAVLALVGGRTHDYPSLATE